MDVKNKHIIIFEGFDNTGKTTIAKELSSVLGIQYFKNPAERERFKIPDLIDKEAIVEAQYLINFIKQVSLEGDGIVLDRHIPSHFVYSEVFRRNYDFEAVIKIDEELAKLGAILIYCYKTKTKTESYQDDLVDEFNRGLISDFYEKYLKFTKMRFLKLDTTDEDIKKQFRVITNFIFE